MSRLFLLSSLGSLAAAAIFFVADATGSIDGAKPGARIVWSGPEGQTLSIVNKSYDPAIVIDASKANLRAVVIRNSRGVHIKGGTVIGPGGRSYGVHIDRSRDVRIEGMTITGAHRGIVINRSEELEIRNNQFVGLISDGLNMASSRRILVEGNSCERFRPNLATYDANGKRIRDGDHPDCIQAWSRPEAPPVSDVRVIGNRAEGAMQGIFFGNHVRNGIDDGGFDRITIEGNIIEVSFPNGILLSSARDSAVRNNRISTVPGAVMPNRPDRKVIATLRIFAPIGVTVCGNRIAGSRDLLGTDKCAP